jgi:O-antigen/teichoic acid export membrane protein
VNILKHLRASAFLRHNVIFFAGSVTVGALNYAYYPILGRLLPPVAFGEVQTLISLFLQVTIFLTVLGLVTINVVANYRSDSDRDAVVLEFERLALAISILLLVITALFQNSLKRFLQFDDSWPFILLMLALVASVPFTFRGAFLRGKQRFGLASLVNIIAAAGKIAASAGLVLLGLGTVGAVGGLVIAQAVSCGFAIWWAKQSGLQKPANTALLRPLNMRLLRPEIRYGLLVLIGSLVVTLQYSIDIVIVKHVFDPHTAGLYAGVASVARIIFFLTASISLVLMPMVRIGAPAKENQRLLFKSMVLLCGAGLPVLAIFVAAPEWVVALLMGDGYATTAHLLPALSVAIFIVSVTNLIVSYYLALRRYSLLPIIIIGAVVTYVLLAIHHDTLSAVVHNLLIGSSIMLFLLLVTAKKLTTRS